MVKKHYLTDEEIFFKFAFCNACGKKFKFCTCKICEPVATLRLCEKMMARARGEDRRQSMEVGLITKEALVKYADKVIKGETPWQTK
jgi:hypothetical protein